MEPSKWPHDNSNIQLTVYKGNGRAPTNDAVSETKKGLLLKQLLSVLEAVPEHDLLIVMGNWNAKVSHAEEEEEKTIGKRPPSGGVRSDNREGIVDFCAMNDFVIASASFSHRDEMAGIRTRLTTSLSITSLDCSRPTPGHTGV